MKKKIINQGKRIMSTLSNKVITLKDWYQGISSNRGI